MDEEAVRWNIKVSKSTDIAVRSLLAQDGLKKGDLSKFIEDAVRWRVFQQTVERAKARNSHMSGPDMDAAIDEALVAVRAERFGDPG